MQFYSTNLESARLGYEEALLRGQAPDRGLYLPAVMPTLSPEEMLAFREMDYPEIAFCVIRKFVAEEINDQDLRLMCQDAYNFPVPLEQAGPKSYVMRLDQGPTASFKDFAARMMGRQMAHFLKGKNQNLCILTATSGDTGSAVANAFFGLENIKVVVLFPKDEVTDRQRKQMTTLGRNIQILALDAKFDDCQALVKQAFSDPELASLNLSSANSINIGRLIPQAVYYFYAHSRLSPHQPITFSVPSGNFGDMMGGIIAMKMGLPVSRFIIAVNENDEFPQFLNTGEYRKIEPSRNCLSSAMNVGHPSNLARLIALYGGHMDEKGLILKPADMVAMRQQIWSCSVTDEETRQTIQKAWKEQNLLLEPHGAVAWNGLARYLQQAPAEGPFVAIETAHPAKFPQEINNLLGFDPQLPESLKGIEEKPEHFLNIESDYHSFKTFLQTQ